MATTRSFSAMLNEYLPDDLLVEELLKRDWLMSNCDKDQNWKGGNYVVAFQGAGATSVKFGSLSSSSDIAEYQYVRGGVSTYKEAWGSLIFNHKDLQEHNGKVNEASFLKILPGQIDSFVDYMKMVISINLMCGPHFATLTVDGTAGGVMEVDRIDRFQIGQKLTLLDGNTAQADYYVIAVDVNGGTLKKGAVTVSAARGGGVADISAYTVAQGAKAYHDGILVGGVVTNGFVSLKSALLSAANGGSTALYGVTKTLWPYLQAVNIDGSGMAAATVLAYVFDGYTQVRQTAKGNASTVVLSFKHLGSIMKTIEASKGAYKVTPNSEKASIYGWTEIEVTSVKGTLKILGIQEMDNDVIFYLDMGAFKFASNGMLQKRTAPDGKQYFEIRNTSGYQYIVDVQLFGELIVDKPGACGVIYGIPNY